MMKERMKGERGKAKEEVPDIAPVVTKGVPKVLLMMKEEPKKELNLKQDFNPTGDVEIEEDDEVLGNPFKTKKKEKGEDFDFDAQFDDDNKEDRFTRSNDFDDEKKKPVCRFPKLEKIHARKKCWWW